MVKDEALDSTATSKEFFITTSIASLTAGTMCDVRGREDFDGIVLIALASKSGCNIVNSES
jgi:hypothetical protein